ncbi:YjbQ family protein [Candidatus Aerophobetes bacterium]|uniref:YjbQ family protein n=1 Tax=Aerophobetes bacterium TaxID=2030807 RepID=A0A662DEY1_UNCAE|nr:MAG: YjbQ family protein [Candidatus Aerophobetes bacterium]
MTKVLNITTRSRVEFIDVTDRIEQVVKEAKVKTGVCWIFAPHTTAAVAINEGADPSVRRDIINWLEETIPRTGNYQHLEGNSPAHIKASLLGSSRAVIIENGDLHLGTWQSIYFCEFDGPRRRKLIVKILEG